MVSLRRIPVPPPRENPAGTGRATCPCASGAEPARGLAGNIRSPPRVPPPSFRRRPESRGLIVFPENGRFTNRPYETVAVPARSPRAFARICGYGAFPRMRENPPREGGGEPMGFGERMMTKARAWVRAFVAPRRSRVVNPGEEEGLRNPPFSPAGSAFRNPRIAGSAGAARARRSRHDENDPVFDKIRQIHGLIPQIHAFFRQIQDPPERGKNIKSLKIRGL